MTHRIPQDIINPNRVKYFDLQEYVANIKLSDSVLFHMEETADNFTLYLKALGNYCNHDEYTAVLYWLDSCLDELKNSAEIEKHTFKNSELLSGGLFFDRLSISHERIKKIHEFISEKSEVTCEKIGEYRQKEASVGAFYEGEYVPYWYGAEQKDIKKFMDSFIKFYKTCGISNIYSNPFIKSALAQLLFFRIHPFGDGNGRCARIIQNISFTSGVNRVYGTNLKLSPVNISMNIKIFLSTYVNYIDHIRFDLEHQEDNNYWINKFFDFMLNMYDDQLFFQNNQLKNMNYKNDESQYSEYYSKSVKEEINDSVSKGRVKKLFNN